MPTTNIYDMADAWNDAGTDFTAIGMDVTDTASGAGSKLLDLKVGGATKFSVSKTGQAKFEMNNRTIEISNDYGLRLTSGSGLPITHGTTPIAVGHLTYGLGVNILSFGTATGAATRLQQDDVLHKLALRNGTNPQEFRVYNTYTDASNYERASLKWDANVWKMRAEAAGTGTPREFQISAGSLDQVRVYSEASTGAFGKLNLEANHQVIFKRGTSLMAEVGSYGLRVLSNAYFALQERSSDPGDPPEGQTHMWMSNGSGSGDDGDIMLKITAGGVTKTVTLVDFSAV